MSGFWYSAAIATTTAALFSLTADIATERTHILSPAPAASSPAQKSHHSDPEAATNPENATPLTGQRRYQQAMTLANQAVVAYQSARQAETLAKQVALTRQERDLWQQTLELLTSIPTDAVEHAQAARKAVQYRQLLATAEGKLTTADRTFLTQIIQSARVNPQRVHVTLCQLGGPVTQSHRQSKRGHSHSQKGRLNRDRCRDHQGDMPMASPASLIKLPIAIALLDKVATENVDLSSRIYIDPGNFTENAAGANIEVGQEYPLSQVMTRMINESNNIATNQLIDYVGHADIAETLLNRGYTSTLVGHKLAGDRILPKNPGTQTNRATTNDITVMMAHTYSLENPGDEELLKALVSQNDQEFGYQALQDLDPAIKWLGEKTGQNNRVIGSTLAMEVGADRYALTVAIDHSADPHAMRAIIRQVAEYLLAAGSLTETSERSPALPSAALNSEGPEHKDSEEKVQAPAETTS